jgi:hypothetical protein
VAALLPRAETCAEEMREDVLGSAPAAASRAAAPPRAERELELKAVCLATTAAAARKSLEALEAGLALGVDLAAVELGALLGLA